MVKNFWTDRQENNGRNSYWNLVDAAKKDAAIRDEKAPKLNASEKKIVDFMLEAEKRYIECHIPPIYPKLAVADVQDCFASSSPLMLEALTSCCTMTGIFVPIKDILFEMNDLPYEKQHALWKGTGYKGHSSYAESFIEKSLIAEVKDVNQLYALHKQMEVKGLKLGDFYEKSMQQAFNTQNTSSIWTSENSQSMEFKKIVFNAFDNLKKYVSLPIRICSHRPAGYAPILNEMSKGR